MIYRVKFFGAKQERHEQLKQIKLTIEARDAEHLMSLLRNRYGYKVINGLKIRQESEGGGL